MTDTKSPAKRVLLVGAVGQVKVSLKGVGASILRACDMLEPHLRDSELFAVAPFDCLHLIIQVAETEDRRVRFDRIDGRYRELPSTVRVAADFVLNKAPAQLDDDLRELLIDAIVQVADKYDASPDQFLALCRRVGPE